MGFFKNFFNGDTDKISSTSMKLVEERGNGWYSYGTNDIFKNDLIRSCTRVISESVGKLSAEHIRGEGANSKVNNDVYMRMLLTRPNPLMSMQVLLEKVTNQLVLNGNAFCVIVRDSNNIPVEIYPINASSVEVVYIGNELYLKFYSNNGATVQYPYKNIIHIRNSIYNNDVFGESPIPAILDLLNVIKTTDNGIVRAIKNSATLRWLLKFRSNLKPSDITARTQEFANNFLDVSKSVGIAGIDVSTDAVQVKNDNYIPSYETTDAMTERIYSFFGVNKAILQSNYNENQWIAFYESVIERIAKQLSEEFTAKLFTRREIGFGNKVIFSGNNLIYASMQTKISLQGFVQNGIMCVNEVRNILSMSPVEGGDTFLLRKDTGTLNEQIEAGKQANPKQNTQDTEIGGEKVVEENTNKGSNSIKRR